MNADFSGYQDIVEAIRAKASLIGWDVVLMEVCGGHTNVVVRYGIRDVLPSNVRLVSGPGCPVCVTAQHDIDAIIAIARSGVPVATYGDMMRVPGSSGSLDDARAAGARVFEVYSAADVVGLAGSHPGVVFFGVGFETTAPASAYLLKNGVCVYSCHKLIAPAMGALVASEDMKIDGFIDPGHVCAVAGTNGLRAVGVAQAVAGFSPKHVLIAIDSLLGMIIEGRTGVVNCYQEAVTESGNALAQGLVSEFFSVADSEWRGLGVIPLSGLEVRDSALDAKVKYADIISGVGVPHANGCRCGEVLRGVIEPVSCPLFGRACRPETPFGACMVSAEGSCAIYFGSGRRSDEA